MKRICRSLAVFICLVATSLAQAAQGVTSESITLLQTADLSGTRAPLVKELNVGWQAYLAHVNAQGGVHGRKVILRSEDDGYVVEKTRQIVMERIRHDDIFAVVSTIGTSNAAATLPLLKAANVPLIAPFSGAEELRRNGGRNVFHIRASYAQEVEKMIEHVLTLGLRRVAVFYDDDAFGQDVLKAAEGALATRGLKLVAQGRVSRGSAEVTEAVQQISRAAPQVVICGSFGKSLVAFVGQMKSTGTAPSFYALSFFPAGPSIAQLGPDARGISVTQVMPRTDSVGSALVREFQALLNKQAPGTKTTPISLEGYVTAKVTIEGLRRAGPNPTRERFVVALESLRDFDLGSLRLTYGPHNRSGLRFVDISVVGETGRLLH